MKLVAINVGNLGYGKYSIPFIEKLCKKNNIEFICLDQDIKLNCYKLHPSWLKLFLHELYEDDFIISWDLDLVPCQMYDLKEYFDLNKINLSYDSSYIYDGNKFNGKFKYNCGLIGIPKSYSETLINIYLNMGLNSRYPSYEQYHVNDWIYDNNIEINLLPEKLNCMRRKDRDFPEDTLNKHYTYSVLDDEGKEMFIKQHYEIHGDILND